MNSFFYALAKLYAYIYVGTKAVTGRNIPGLGFLLRRCIRSRYIDFLDQKLYFEPAIASNYGLHIINLEQEPESHNFLNELFDKLGNVESCFIEVGANIGVFMVDLARRSKVNIIGFEPSNDCCKSIKKTMLKNGRRNFTIYENLVGDRDELVSFSEGKNVQEASIYTSTNSFNKIQQIKLDNVKELMILPDAMPSVLMIDVEGYEPNVLRGAGALIKRLKPLVLFEYNFVSKRYFHVNEIHQILGDSYAIFRLRKDAMLDSDVENSWNCVAVPLNTQFETILKSKILSQIGSAAERGA